MNPYPVQFHLYAESQNEIEDLQRALYNLVSALYEDGVYVTAPKVTQAVKRFGQNPFIKQYFK